MDNTLSRDGTAPNQMEAPLDMNGYHLRNLPKPLGAADPVRLTDLADVSEGTFTPLPEGGSLGQPLAKNSSTDYDASWATITGSGNFVKSGSPTITSPAINSATLTSATINSSTLNSPTLVTPALGTPTSGNLSNTTNLPISTGVSGLGTGVATFLGTPTAANLKSTVVGTTGVDELVFATTPNIVNPALGTPTQVNLTNATNVPVNQATGNLSVNRLNSGTNASANTFWRGDGSWQFAGITPIETLTPSAASSAASTGSFALFSQIMIILDNLSMSASGDLLLQVKTTAVQDTNYTSGVYTILSGAPSALGTGTAKTTGYILNASTIASGSTNGLSGTYYIHNANGSGFKNFQGMGSCYNGASACLHMANGVYTGGSGVITGIQLTPSTGTITGTVKIYGVA
jgi:hypothetical protein